MQTSKSMTKIRQKLSTLLPSIFIFQPQFCIFIVWGIVGFLVAIAIAWFLGERTTVEFLTQLNTWQENPPLWLKVPKFDQPYYLWLPSLILLIFSQGIMHLSPQPKRWSQVIIVSLLLGLIIRYFFWRSLSTLNLSNSLNGLFSISLFLIETVIILTAILRLYLTLKITPRNHQADQMSVAVIEGKYLPSVDILIPSFNEPISIVKRTIIGCQALEYENKKIYFLDDKKRPEMEALAKELGCFYITRQDNLYAKAGNLNHALAKTSGELIVVFDADFIPSSNFLTRTIGFYQDKTIGIVQTYQSFYNSDPGARNLGLENTLPQDSEVFARYYQRLRDGIETAVCYGSSFVVRRSYLEEIGGFVIDSLSEDYFTGIRLSSQGYRVIYLDESLSAGLSAENMLNHIQQRLRWARGTLQGLFINSNPLIQPGLSLLQKLAHLEGILQWLFPLFRVIFLFIPLAYVFLEILPVRTTLQEWIYFFIPLYLIQLSTFSWLNYRSRSAIIDDICAVAYCFPISLAVVQTLLNPFSGEFKVTPKGLSRNHFKFNWLLASPLIVTLIVTSISLGYHLYFTFKNQPDWLASNDPTILGGIALIYLWSAYNLLILTVAILMMLDIPKPDIYEWFPSREKIKLSSDQETYWGITTQLSEIGAEIELKNYVDNYQNLTLELLERGLKLRVKVTQVSVKEKVYKLRLVFEKVTLSDYRKLVEILFCRPGQWQRRETPGEFNSILLLLKALFRPLIFLQKKRLLDLLYK